MLALCLRGMDEVKCLNIAINVVTNVVVISHGVCEKNAVEIIKQ